MRTSRIRKSFLTVAVAILFFASSLRILQRSSELSRTSLAAAVATIDAPLFFGVFNASQENDQSNAPNTTYSSSRNFSYLSEPLERRYQNRTIVFVFAGRRYRLETQLLYLERLIEDEEIDYVHYYHCGPFLNDSIWLKSLPDHYPSWFELRDCFGGEPFQVREKIHQRLTDWTRVFQEYERIEYESSLFIKIDDDIVYLPVGGAITNAVEYTRSHPEASWVSGLAVNNGLVDHILQRDGIIPRKQDMKYPLPQETFGGKRVVGLQSFGETQKHRKAWQLLHDFFLKESEVFHNLNGAEIFPTDYRVCLNAMFFTSPQLKRWEMKPGDFDEIHIKSINFRKNISVHLFKGAPFVHMSYNRQNRAKVVKPGYDGKYRDFACDRLNITNLHPSCAEHNQVTAT